MSALSRRAALRNQSQLADGDRDLARRRASRAVGIDDVGACERVANLTSCRRALVTCN